MKRRAGVETNGRSVRPTATRKRSTKLAKAPVAARAMHAFLSDGCFDLAAGLTYFALLSVFPAILFLVALLGIVGQAATTTRTVLSIVDDVSPKAISLIKPVLEQLVSSPAAGWTVVVGLVIGVWSASNYVGAFGRAMNRIYGVREGRPFWKLKPQSLVTTVVILMLVALLGVVLVVSGPVAESIGDVVGLGETGLAIWNVAKWPLMVFFVVLFIAVLYSVTPNVRQTKFRWLSIGALVAILLIGLISLGFVFYINNFSSYNAIYGAIGGAIVAIVWLWCVNLALLFGAEVDVEVERDRELRDGVAAEHEIQLPLRDERRIVKTDGRNARVAAEDRGRRRSRGRQGEVRRHRE